MNTNVTRESGFPDTKKAIFYKKTANGTKMLRKVSQGGFSFIQVSRLVSCSSTRLKTCTGFNVRQLKSSSAPPKLI